MGETETVPHADALDAPGAHVRHELAGYAARRLDSEAACRVEAHLLVCDACFAALVVLTVDRA